MIFFSEKDMIIVADGGTEIMVTMQTIIQAAAILLIGIAIIVGNALVVATLLLTAKEQRDAMSYYLLSLAIADLLFGLLVVPLSVYPAIVQRWVYGEAVCRLEGYAEVTLWTVTVYTFMWIGVDRYLAIRKPLRYEALQTRTRCQCWVVFSWVTATLLCCPPLLGFSRPLFHEHTYLCTLDWSLMVPYSVTLLVLVLGPSIITIAYTYAYIFATMRRTARRRRRRSSTGSRSGVPSAPGDREYATALTENLANPYHCMSFALVLTFWVSWLPFLVLHLYERVVGEPVESPLLHFCLTWMGVLNSFWKTLVHIFMSPQFRHSLRMLCAALCCRFKDRQELICD